MPGHGGRPAHASSSFVWTEWNADIGYGAGFTFVAGMLNGAFAVGTPDVTTYVAPKYPYRHDKANKGTVIWLKKSRILREKSRKQSHGRWALVLSRGSCISLRSFTPSTTTTHCSIQLTRLPRSIVKPQDRRPAPSGCCACCFSASH